MLDPARLEPLIELLTANRQALKPQPQENGAFRLVNVAGQARQVLAKPRHCLLCPLLVERAHRVATDCQNFTGVEQGLGQCRTKGAAGQADDGVGIGERGDDVLSRHDDVGAHAGEGGL